LRAEELLHLVVAYENGRYKDARKAARFDWNAIWRAVIATLESLPVTAPYPVKRLICLDESDNRNDHVFLLDIHSPVPTNLVAEALEAWEHRVQNGYEFSCLSREREGRYTWGIAQFFFGDTCFILISDFSGADAPILHLRTYNVPEHAYAASMKAVCETLQDEFPFLRNMN
jgi:hypothetical protein